MEKDYSNKIIGIWKFSSKITPEALKEVAEKWAREDSKYEHLYVRQTSKDQHGIGFEYKAYEGEDADAQKQAYDDYFEQMTDRLKKEFGNDLAGWDISSRAYIIK